MVGDRRETIGYGTSAGDYDVRSNDDDTAGFPSGHPRPSRGNQAPARVSGRPVPWRKTFGSAEDADIEEYLSQFEAYGKACQWDDATATASLLSTLEGRAIYIVRELPAGTKFDEITQRLRTEWDTPGRKRALRIVFDHRARTDKETPEQYLRELQKLAIRAYGHYSRELREEQLLKRFTEGQSNDVRRAIATHSFDSVSDALIAVIQYEAIPASRGHRDDDKRRNSPPTRRPWNRRAEVQDHDGQRDTIYDDEPERDEGEHIDNPLGGGDAWAYDALAMVDADEDGRFDESMMYTVLKVTARTAKFTGKCYYCKREGHGWTRCFKLRDLLVKNGMKPAPRPDQTPRSVNTTPKVDNNTAKPLNK